MTTRDELLALADRCERATGADREIDCLVFVALTDADDVLILRSGPMILWGAMAVSADNAQVPAYTASLDAAMTLAGDGWYLRVEPRFYSDDGEVRWRAYAIKPDWTRWTPHDDWFEVIGEDDAILAATPALALTAAALRSRAGAAA